MKTETILLCAVAGVAMANQQGTPTFASFPMTRDERVVIATDGLNSRNTEKEETWVLQHVD